MAAFAALTAGCSWQWIRPDAAPSAATARSRPAASIVDANPPAAEPAVALAPRAPEPSVGVPVVPGDLWVRLREEFSFDGLDRPEVRHALAWYKNQRKFLHNTSRRAGPYLHFILEELQRQDLPAELALLPILESGFQPEVVSRYGAAGLWQFMGATGARFGLERSAWYDGRLDVVASTRAAFRYLGALHDRFEGDWLLAIAAYNAGWGNIEQAIAANRRQGRLTDIWSLPVKRETKQLAARLLALVELFRHPERYGVTLQPVPDRPYFREVQLQKPTDLRRYASLVGVPSEKFKRLNPGFKTWHTGPHTASSVLVPATTSETALARAAELPAVPVPRRGPAAAAAEVAVTATGRGRIYKVQPGDSLWSIARRFNLRVAELVGLNRIDRNEHLQLDQELRIPVAVGGSKAPPFRGLVRYRVRNGDSLWTISRQFKVTVEDLLAWNNLEHGRGLQPGQELLVYPRT